MVIIEDGLKLDFDNVLIKPRKSELFSRKQVQLNVEYSFPHSQYKWSGVPIMVANMDTTGTFEMAQALSNHNVITCIHKHYSLDDWSNWLNKVQYGNPSIYDRICVSSGTSKNDIHKLSQILNFHPNLKMVMLDIANGYSQHFLDVIQEVRSLFPDKIIIAGNIVTPEMTEDLINRGADIVKGGIGPGSVCTTRKKTGIGYPQLSCVIECSQAAHRLGGLFISDGGCTCPGDFSKAFGAGADFVMSGGMFSGHEESAGEIIIENDKKFKLFYGMSSKKAMDTHSGGVADYRTSEGKVVKIPFKGSVQNTILDILGGIRSTCTYVGAASLDKLSQNTTFIRVSRQLNNVYT